MDPRDVLKQIHLFRDAIPEDLAAVAAIAERKGYAAGEYLYQSGDAPDALFVIGYGTVDVNLKDKDVTVASVGAGQALGEMAFFDRSGRLASAVTRERTDLLRLPFDKLDRVLEERPTLAVVFYRRASVFLARQLRTVAPDLNRRYF